VTAVNIDMRSYCFRHVSLLTPGTHHQLGNRGEVLPAAEAISVLSYAPMLP